MPFTCKSRDVQKRVPFVQKRGLEVDGRRPACIVAGDFNADIDYPPLGRGRAGPVVGEAMRVVQLTMERGCGLHDVAAGDYGPSSLTSHGVCSIPRRSVFVRSLARCCC